MVMIWIIWSFEFLNGCERLIEVSLAMIFGFDETLFYLV